MEVSRVASDLTTNQSGLHNTTETRSPIYVFTPAGLTTKLVIVILLVNVGVLGFVGNFLMYFFISRKKQKLFMKYSPFVQNMNVYLKSLALSDIFSTVISLPLVCIQIMFDVFQHSWACRIVRFFGILFPSIIMNNIIVISIERYMSTRAVPDTFSASTVRKLVFGAWIIGFIIVLSPTATFNGIRYDLSDTHYTIICKYDNDYFLFRVIVASYALIQHLIPSIILTYFNISVARAMWTKQKRRIDIQRDNAIRAAIRATTIRGTYLLVAITFTFIIPYSGSIYYAVYVMLAKPSLDFQADFITRYLSAILFLSNSAINFIIYVVQMEDFRAFLKKLICSKGNAINPIPAGDGI